MQDKEDMEEIIRGEREGELQCMYVKLKNQPCMRNIWIRGVTTRSGKKAENSEQGMPRRGAEGGEVPDRDGRLTVPIS